MSFQQTILVPSKIGPYIFKGTIGEGAFSVVKLAYLNSKDTFYACKIVPRSHLQNEEMEQHFELETRINQQMHHPGIVQIVDLLKDDLNYYIMMEFCPNGELFQFIVDRGKLSEDEAKLFLYEILVALKYIHSLGVAHRDLKPENLLIDSEARVKISDFGLSRFVGYDNLVATPCGSPCYASPECLSGQPYNGMRSDMWSLGVILYAMVTGQLPWTKVNQTQLFDQIRRGAYIIPDYLSDNCRNLISRMLTVDPKSRITDEEALSHQWLQGVENQVPNSKMTLSIISLKKIDQFFDNTDIETSSHVTREDLLPKSQSQVSMNFQDITKIIAVRRQSHFSPISQFIKSSQNGQIGRKPRIPKVKVPPSRSNRSPIVKSQNTRNSVNTKNPISTDALPKIFTPKVLL